ncbi:hypothetical protein DL89DRAFT_295468 [Linderina pennispora]|uniref:Uncharacterized protein n=1 Tax=Linderina pennispora TaxID=61395 RepID=A0A1Y1VZD0_9FUNG|nr:uncharacterized protein DL89DRAFT_295468 [Linderina pennispora]ORX66621.1 hypothetical protein DL89DRAFT_295468 [Linderina pennispora]
MSTAAAPIVIPSSDSPMPSSHRRSSSNIVMPTVRSAGIGGYKNVQIDSMIGGHIRERRDSGMGKLCMPHQSPRSERRFSFKRVMSFSKLRRASAPETN